MVPPDPRRCKEFIENFQEKLERYEAFIEEKLATAKARHIQNRLADLNESWSIYQRMLPPYEILATELLLDKVSSAIEESDISIASEFEEKLEEFKEIRRKLQTSDKKSQEVEPLPPTISAKLPTVELPVFSGEYLEWTAFSGTFDAFIHENKSLSERTKFQYLKLSLAVVAANAISAIELSDENYIVARDILKERFDKPNFICERHIHEDLNLLNLHDHFRAHIRSLQALKRPVKQWDDLIVYLMASKLDPETKAKWNEAAPSTHLPTIDDMCHFLSARAHRLESHPNSTPAIPLPKLPSKGNNRSNRTPATSLIVIKPLTYHFGQCKTKGHTLVRCHRFLHMPIDQRRNFVTYSKLCNRNRKTRKYVSMPAICQHAGIYDPLGFLAPVIVVGKLFIQSLWQLKLDWDQSLPQGMHTDWQTYRESLVMLNKFTIERHLFETAEPYIIEIHGFADPSECAYGAVLYVRSITSTGHVSVKLLCSKSRVAPLKKITVPRLELCAAVLLAQLTFKVSENLNFQVNQTVYWSDSTITLNWIRSCPSRWKTFVLHRMTTIQETNKESWRHVPTESNPADLLSRGMSSDKFLQSNLWLH